MCRFQCSDPQTCKVSKYALGSVKKQLLIPSETTTTASSDQPFYQSSSPSKFVRNKNVQFFYGSSDSEYYSSDDEMTCFQPEKEQQKQTLSPLNLRECHSKDNILLPKSTTTMTSNDSSVDSGFIEEENSSKKLSTENLKDVIKPQLKSILLKKARKKIVEEKQKKCVRFADDCGKFLVRVRNIPAREKIDVLWNDVVDLNSISTRRNENDSSWRDALLYKLIVTAGFSVGTTTLPSTTTTSTT